MFHFGEILDVSMALTKVANALLANLSQKIVILLFGAVVREDVELYFFIFRASYLEYLVFRLLFPCFYRNHSAVIPLSSIDHLGCLNVEVFCSDHALCVSDRFFYCLVIYSPYNIIL